MKIPFTKMHGCGNDYIYVDTSRHPIADPEALAIVWSDRHKGIGSDGLVLIDASPVPEADFTMRIFNADGSEAMMCGNASRCIGKYVYERGLTDKTEIRLLTRSGIKVLQLHVNEGKVDSVTVDMGEPVFEDASLFIPRLAHSLAVSLSNRRGNGAEALFVSMGNPHYVVFTDNVDQVGETGRVLERHPAFPQRCNIEFAAPLLSPQPGGSSRAQQLLPQSGEVGRGLPLSSPQEGSEGECGAFRVRVWERGSGITQACGTGACATAVAAARTGRASRRSQIIMDGGPLDIEWCQADNHVYMTGPATFVFDGEAPLLSPQLGEK